MTLNRRFTALWALWLLAFAALEGAALIDPGAGDTLTEQIRQWLSLSDPHRWIGRAGMVVFLFWLNHHFLRPKPKKQEAQKCPQSS